MQYFNENLEVIISEIENLNKQCENVSPEEKDVLALPFSQELIEVNKLLTVEKYLKIKSPFYQERFKSIITSPNSKEFIPRYGVRMTEEEFSQYLDKYNQEYELW